MVYSEATFNNIVLNVTKITPVKKPKTIKQILGKDFTQIRVIGLDAQQHELDVEGIVLGTTAANLDTNRTAVEGLDSVTPYDWVDGLHNGTYIMQTGSLDFDDKGGNVQTHHKYTFKLIQQ